MSSNAASIEDQSATRQLSEKPSAPDAHDHEAGHHATSSTCDDTHLARSSDDNLRDIMYPGLVRIEALSTALTTTDRVAIFCGLFLVAYAYSLHGTLRCAYQPKATNAMGTHSLTSVVNIIGAVIGAGAQPTAGKVADVFGRVELVIASSFFYVIGTVVESVSHHVMMLAAGTAIHQAGYTMIVLLAQVIVADITSTRSRVFFSYIPALPFIINTWVSGNIAEAVLEVTSWRWGYGI